MTTHRRMGREITGWLLLLALAGAAVAAPERVPPGTVDLPEPRPLCGPNGCLPGPPVIDVSTQGLQLSVRAGDQLDGFDYRVPVRRVDGGRLTFAAVAISNPGLTVETLRPSADAAELVHLRISGRAGGPGWYPGELRIAVTNKDKPDAVLPVTLHVSPAIEPSPAGWTIMRTPNAAAPVSVGEHRIVLTARRPICGGWEGLRVTTTHPAIAAKLTPPAAGETSAALVLTAGSLPASGAAAVEFRDAEGLLLLSYPVVWVTPPAPTATR